MSGQHRKEPFARIPLRLIEALETGEITFAGFALRVYLVGKVNYRTRRHTATLASLKDLAGWSSTKWSDQKLRNELRKLEPDLRAESVQGRDRWTFSVLANDFGLDPVEPQTHFTRETPSSFEVTSNGPLPPEAALAAVESASGTSAPQTAASPQTSRDETSSEPDVDQAQPGMETGSSRAQDEQSSSAQPSARAGNGSVAGGLADGFAASPPGHGHEGAHNDERPKVCPECGTGAGKHVVDCPAFERARLERTR